VKARYFLPLLGFAVPSLLIGFGFVIPGSCIEGVNNHTVGFASTVVGASVT
jgi:ABC-type Fe3+ transport system permease subunit